METRTCGHIVDCGEIPSPEQPVVLALIKDVCFLFLDALASLEPTQVGGSVGDSFKLWAIRAL